MNKIILADSESVFREGAAKVLTMNGDFCLIAQCVDVEGMMHAVTALPGAIVLFASSLRPNMEQLLITVEAAGSRAVVIAENDESIEAYLRQGFRGVLFRKVTAVALVECMRRVARGDTWAPRQQALAEVPEKDTVGTAVLHRLTPKEMRILALIAQGCKNREIASRLKNSEQVVKNYLRSIFDKTGVDDRLALALFTIHHSVLAQAAAEMLSKLEAEEQQAAPTAVAQAIALTG